MAAIDPDTAAAAAAAARERRRRVPHPLDRTTTASRLLAISVWLLAIGSMAALLYLR